VAWIEAGLKRHGVKKVVPDERTLETAFRRAAANVLVGRRLEKVIRQARAKARRATLPEGLARQVKARLDADPTSSWDEVVAEVAAGALADHP
jgi:hypothetical protein